MARRCAALVGAVVALLAFVQPAGATTWSSRSLGHTPFTCSDRSLWLYRSTQVGATIYAAARDKCGHIAFVSGSPTAGYHIERTPFAGYNGHIDLVDSIARDGATTYFVRSNPRYTTHFELWTRGSTGKYTQLRLLTTAGGAGVSRFPLTAVAAAGGHWAVAWRQYNKYQTLTTYAESTMPGHTGRTEQVTGIASGVDNSPVGMVATSSASVKLILAHKTSAGESFLALQSTTSGWSAGRALASVKYTNGTGPGMSLMGLVQRSYTTYMLLFLQNSTSTGTELEVVTDTGSTPHRVVVTTTAASFTVSYAVDPVTGYQWIATVRGTNYDRTDLYTNATGSWRSRALAFGSDVGLDGLTAYSGKPAVYYSPASTPQDTVYYAH